MSFMPETTMNSGKKEIGAPITSSYPFISPEILKPEALSLMYSQDPQLESVFQERFTMKIIYF